MPSFDVVSEIDMHEVRNAVDQAIREVSTRFDFKGKKAEYSLDDAGVVTLTSESEFQLQQMLDILYAKLTRRGVDIGCAEPGGVELAGRHAHQTITLRHGIDSDMARRIVRLIKDARLKKVQAAIQGDQVRVSGKKRDDLQEAIALLREADLGLPLQFRNFRD